MNKLKKKWYLDFDYSKNGIYWTRVLSLIIMLMMGTVIISLMTGQKIIDGIIAMFVIFTFIFTCATIGNWLEKNGYKLTPIGPMRK